MPRGGSQPGSGRPAGAREVKKTAADYILKRRESGKKDPIQVIFEAMDKAIAEQKTEKAVEYAALVLPYTSPKLSAVAVSGGAMVVPVQPVNVPEETLKEILSKLNENF